MEKIFHIFYTFSIPGSPSITIDIPISSEDLTLATRSFQKEAWLELDYEQCSNCPLRKSEHPYCPAATAIAGLIRHFKDSTSYQECEVTVQVPERTYIKKTTLQEGIRSILGIYMPISGCPHLVFLRPMVRFHLPFANTTETLFRSVGSYLIAQFLRSGEGQPADWNLEVLKQKYGQVHLVNLHFARRLRAAIRQDATANSLVILDTFSQSVPFSINKALHELKPLFSSFFQDTSEKPQTFAGET